MTLVVTHANGFLACFTHDEKGALKQRALINTGDEPPTALELAEIATRLSNEYQWNGAPAPRGTKAITRKASTAPHVIELPATGDEARRLKDSERKRKERQRWRKREQAKREQAAQTPRPYDTSDTQDIPERLRMITGYLRTHPNSTVPEVIAGLGMEPTTGRLSRWYHHFTALRKSGEIVLGDKRDTPGHPREYYVP